MHMRRFLQIILPLCCLTHLVQAAGSLAEHSGRLKHLDRMISDRGRYHIEKEKGIDSLRSKLRQAVSDQERFEWCCRLYETYIVYQTDSALRYVLESERLLRQLPDDAFRYRAQLNRVGVMTVTGMYKEALDALNQIPRHAFSGDLLQSYFHHSRTLYGHMADYALTNDEKNAYLQSADRYRDSLLFIMPHGEINTLIVEADRFNTHGQFDATIAMLKPVTDTCRNTERMRFLAYTLSEAYALKGDRENQKYYLTLSAIADLKTSVREYISLRKLAFLLYEDGDIDRAYEYMKCSLEDAQSCNARSRTIEVAEIFPVIDKAYRLRSERKQRTITLLLASVSLLALCLVAAIIYVYRQMKKLAVARQALADANRQLQTINNTLKETNLIKEEYIAQYINRCSAYIDKLDHYRRRLTKLASTSKLEELFRAIKSDEFIEAERKEFYNEFDHTFLSLFPNFVTDFNKLLNEKDRITPKPGDLLNTELRIFALIRLGITDSTRIAEFLQYSLTTIYNYRSKVRNKAVGDKNEFEAAVIRIG